MRLLIVEFSPKARTIQQHLGPGYTVVATAGHFRDLPERELGADLVTFAPRLVLDPQRHRLLARLQRAVRAASLVYLATDADREGEALSWHLALGLKHARRIRFTEITPGRCSGPWRGRGRWTRTGWMLRWPAGSWTGWWATRSLPCSRSSAPTTPPAGCRAPPSTWWSGARSSASSSRPSPTGRSRRTTARASSRSWSRPIPRGELSLARLPSAAVAQTIQAEAGASPHRAQSVVSQQVERAPKPPFTISTLQQAASVLVGLGSPELMAHAQGRTRPTARCGARPRCRRRFGAMRPWSTSSFATASWPARAGRPASPAPAY